MSDFSIPNPPKEETRRDNLNALRESRNPHLFRKGKLVVDWLELCGANAPTLAFLESEEVLNPPKSRFIGVDRDKAVIEGCQKRYPGHVFVHGEVSPLFGGSDPDFISRVGVFNYDTEEEWETLWKIDRHVLANFVKTQREKLGSFFLIMNGVSKNKVDSSREDARKFLEFVYGHVYGRTLPLDFGTKAIVTYKGKNTKGGNRNWPMVHVRAMF